MYLEENQQEEALIISRQCVNYVETRTATVESKVLAYGNLHEVLAKMPSKKEETLYYKQKIIALLNNVDKAEGILDDIALSLIHI